MGNVTNSGELASLASLLKTRHAVNIPCAIVFRVSHSALDHGTRLAWRSKLTKCSEDGTMWHRCMQSSTAHGVAKSEVRGWRSERGLAFVGSGSSQVARSFVECLSGVQTIAKALAVLAG